MPLPGAKSADVVELPLGLPLPDQILVPVPEVMIAWWWCVKDDQVVVLALWDRVPPVSDPGDALGLANHIDLVDLDGEPSWSRGDQRQSHVR